MPPMPTFSSAEIQIISDEMRERHIEDPEGINASRIGALIDILVETVTRAFNELGSPYRKIVMAEKQFADAMVDEKIMSRKLADGMGQDIIDDIQGRARGV